MGSIEENDERNDTRAFTVRLPKDEYEALKAFALYTDATMSDVLLRALREFLAADDRERDIDDMLREARARIRRTVQRFKD